MEIIPVFPKFATLNIGHKPLIDAYLKQANVRLSELNFTEIFAWHKIRDIMITSHNGNICLYMNKSGKKYFYPPFGPHDPAKSVVSLLEWLAVEEPEAFFYCFDEEGAKACEATGRLAAEEDRDNADYVYYREDLVTLAGRKYDGKRNHLKHFLRDNEFTFEPVTGVMVPEIIEFQQRWCEQRACEDDLSLINESKAMREVLDCWPMLDVFGAVIRIKGKIQAFTAASELNSDTAVVLFEKGNPEYRGIYQAINQQFCGNMPEKFKWINREQDAGDEGLRKAKLSYNPVRVEMKYVVRLRG